jgi:uncharacterized protein (DUF58 family)
MNLEELIGTVQKIDIVDKSLYKQKRSGSYTSTLKGHGLTFDTIRKYEIGDDVKNINWNVTARLREPYVNTFTDDKERLIWIIIDVSGSTILETNYRNKFDLEIEIGAVLAYSAIKRNDSVGIIFFSNKIEKIIMPNKGMASFWHIAKTMVDMTASGKTTDINIALQLLMKIGRKRSIVFILSDFISDDYMPSVKVLQQNHNIIAIRIYDELEYDFPNVGWVKLKDAETGIQKWVNTSSKKFKKNFSDQFEIIDVYFKNTFNYHTKSTLSINTRENVVEKLLKFMNEQ